MERITLPLRRDQLENLIHLERESWDFCFQGCLFKERSGERLMGNRSRGSKKQRITKNSLIRTYIDLLLSLKIDTREISDEKALTSRYKAALKAVKAKYPV